MLKSDISDMYIIINDDYWPQESFKSPVRPTASLVNVKNRLNKLFLLLCFNVELFNSDSEYHSVTVFALIPDMQVRFNGFKIGCRYGSPLNWMTGRLVLFCNDSFGHLIGSLVFSRWALPRPLIVLPRGPCYLGRKLGQSSWPYTLNWSTKAHYCHQLVN